MNEVWRSVAGYEDLYEVSNRARRTKAQRKHEHRESHVDTRTTLAEHFGSDTAAMSAMITKLEVANVAITPNQPVTIADGYVHHEGVKIAISEQPAEEPA